MPMQTIKLTKSEEVAEGTMTFRFTRPSGFEFRPGQSVDITLIDPTETDAEGNTRAFSIASPPDSLQIRKDSRSRRLQHRSASDLFRDVFGTEKMAVRPVIGVASLRVGVPIELEVIFEVAEQQGTQRLLGNESSDLEHCDPQSTIGSYRLGR